ncbi:MAG: hypothetical protein ACI4E1_02420 [Lachnospira sp.]
MKIYKRKRILAILLCLAIAILSGCQRKMVNENTEAEEDSDHVSDEGPTWEVDKESSDKIIVANMGEEMNVVNMKINVTDMVISANINDVSKIADDEGAQVIINDLLTDFGPGSIMEKINGHGWLNADGTPSAYIKEFIFLKMTVRNDMKRKHTVCFMPRFYSKNSSGSYQYEGLVEPVAISKKQLEGADQYYYTFDMGQQEEFIVAFMSRKELAGTPLYMSTKFLYTSTGPTIIDDGSVFIKVTEGE